jgi:hypothetical protein
MGVDISEERQKAHAYLDRLPAAQLAALVSLLESMMDPVAQVIAHAAADEEPLIDEDRKALAEADKWRQNHEPIPLETVLDEFGLTMKDWEEMGKTHSPDGRG